MGPKIGQAPLPRVRSTQNRYLLFGRMGRSKNTANFTGTSIALLLTAYVKALNMNSSNEKFQFPQSRYVDDQYPVSSGVQPTATQSPVPLMNSGTAEQGRNDFGQEQPRAVDFSTARSAEHNASIKRRSKPVVAVTLVALAGLAIAVLFPSVSRRVVRSYRR